MDRVSILAADPGLTTGLAWCAFEDGKPDGFWSGELPTWQAVKLSDAMMPLYVDVCVAEAFVPRPGKRTWQPEAIESIGALRYLSEKAGVEYTVRSKPDKRFKKKLQRLGWRNPTPGDHADDAAVLIVVEALVRGLLDVSLVE